MVSHELFLDLADAYAWRSTCLRRRFGSVIIDPRFDDPISGGFNGAPRGMPHCTDTERCLRDELGIKEGERYELCCSSHSEQNAMIKAGNRAYGCTLYLVGWDAKTNKRINPKPCFLCTKMMINARIEKVVTHYAIYNPIELYESYVASLYGSDRHYP